MKPSEQGMRIYTSHYYYMELNTAKMLHDLNLDFEIADANLIRRINKIEKIQSCIWMICKRLL